MEEAIETPAALVNVSGTSRKILPSAGIGLLITNSSFKSVASPAIRESGVIIGAWLLKPAGVIVSPDPAKIVWGLGVGREIKNRRSFTSSLTCHNI